MACENFNARKSKKNARASGPPDLKGHARSVVDDMQRELREAQLSSARLLHLAMLVTGKKN